MAMKLFPHILIRLSGRDFEQLESLNLNDSILKIQEIAQLNESMQDVKGRICQRLYIFIQKREDPKVQNLLLNIRRLVFKERVIPPDILDIAIPILPDDMNEELKNYLKIREALDYLWDEGEKTFTQETLLLRKKLHTLATDEILQKGLLLSSQSLLKCIPSYLSKPEPTNKKDFQTERGLIKYISRMVAKTSPFSTFTNLVMAAAEPAPENSNSFLWLKGTQNGVAVHHIRLNNYLYSYLKILMLKNPDIYRRFLVRPNPTLKQIETHYLFLTNNNNTEAFQRIPVNPVLDVFHQLSSEKKEGASIHDLIKTIIDNEYIDAPAEDLEAYILQLIEYGFLEYNIGVSGVDPDWDIKLIDVLEEIHSTASKIPMLDELTETLKNVRSLARLYGEASCEKRNNILEEAFNRFKATCMKLHEAAGLPKEERIPPGERLKMAKESQKEAQKETQKDEQKNEGELEEKDENKEDEVFKHRSNTQFTFRPEQMFYEDSTVNLSLCVNEANLEEFTGALHNVLQKMRCFEGIQDERDKMRSFFVNKYGKDATVELMTFYEDYYREYKKPEAEYLKKEKALQTDERFVIPSIKERQEKNKSWMEQYTAILKEDIAPNTDCVHLTSLQLEQTRKKFGEGIPLTERLCSYGGFIQFYKEPQENGEEKLMGVLNASFPGFGKLFSRFFHIFDETYTETLREWNLSLQNDFILAEDTDASYFNANLHPPLLPYEIRMPGGHNTLPTQQQIPITELEVRPNESGRKLQLIHKPTQKRVYALDLGFQGHKGRSELFQLLEKFTLSEYLYCAPMIQSAYSLFQPEKKPDAETNDDPRVIVYPRIVYNDRIVLTRKTWIIPVEMLPFKESDESHWKYFVRVDQWRRDLKIPGEVFVHVLDRIPGKAGVKPKSKQNPTRDDYKPQYISFRNPFLVDLFEKMTRRVPFTMKVVEMLPNSSQLLKFGERRHISEFTVQWYTGPQRFEGEKTDE